MPKAKRKQRQSIPLEPNRKICYVAGARIIQLEPKSFTHNDIGLKAWGLASIPEAWTKPFFVVKGKSAPTSDALEKAIRKAGINQSTKLLVRSSGTNEAIGERGSLISKECEFGNLGATIDEVETIVSEKTQAIHWIIQPLIDVRAKGHLSNERRLCEVHRDWEVEFEPGRGQLPENRHIALRTWRDNRPPESHQELNCLYRANCVDTLKVVAHWAYERLLRLHFEWVWDGQTIFIVQADACDDPSSGVRPESLVQIPSGSVNDHELKVFRKASSADFEKYRKLSNVAVYARLGYQPVQFYVLDDRATLASLITRKECAQNLYSDLQSLTTRPLVIRTNGPEDMLPRSDELRSADAARTWLVGKFADDMKDYPLDGEDRCLIAHHFVPATASAWCLAHPDRRRVRIESLWGIPEGLYWYAHDVFDVDTKIAAIDTRQSLPGGFTKHESRRYKSVFVAPNSSGDWILHATAVGPDWRRSIREEKWINTIAWDSRRIAKSVGHSVVLMWFVDVPPEISKHDVMPWYHQRWSDDGALPRAAPRKKQSGVPEFSIRDTSDWETLKSTSNPIARVVVDPKEALWVRDEKFAKALGNLAKERGFIVELAGGILSHAYYALTRTGCNVECADLYAMDEETLEFNKLVRDKIPDSIQAQGELVEVKALKGEALIEALKRKLIEESFEVGDATSSDEIGEELADLYEVAMALTATLGIDASDIESTRTKKGRKRGAFKKGLMLARTSLEPTIRLEAAQTLEVPLGQPEAAVGIISRIEELPSEYRVINVDRRRDASGTLEVQVTVSLPAHVRGVSPGNQNLSLDTPAGIPHEMTLQLVFERDGADIRCIFHLKNPPTQLQLPLDEQGKT